MKKLKIELLLTALFFSLINISVAQENRVALSGGYTFGNIEDDIGSTSGWRINAAYEFTPLEENLSHGISFGYIQNTASVSIGVGLTDGELKSEHFPIYYVPKYTFLESGTMFRPFIKGALGFHLSDYNYSLPPGGQINTSDGGFYGGFGAGLHIYFSDNVLINLEYEFTYVSNSWYVDGVLNSAMFGVGMEF